MVYRMNLTYSENENYFDVEYFGSDLHVYGLPPGVYKTMDFNNTLPSIVRVAIDDNRFRKALRIELNTAVLRFRKNFSFHTTLGFTIMEGSFDAFTNEERASFSGTV